MVTSPREVEAQRGGKKTKGEDLVGFSIRAVFFIRRFVWWICWGMNFLRAPQKSTNDMKIMKFVDLWF